MSEPQSSASTDFSKCNQNILLEAFKESVQIGIRSQEHSPNVWLEIMQERDRQDKKWGEQNHPSVDQVLFNRGASADRMCDEYEIPTEVRAKALLEMRMQRGALTFAHIAVEELSEVVAASNDVDRREELVQLAAVAIQWIEAIDRRAALARQERAKM